MSDPLKDDWLADYLKTAPDQFISSLVHDVRGPLSGIISASKLMEVILADMPELSQSDHAQLAELTRIIQKAAGNMRGILDAAVEYDRIQRKK